MEIQLCKFNAHFKLDSHNYLHISSLIHSIIAGVANDIIFLDLCTHACLCWLQLDCTLTLSCVYMHVSPFN